MNPFPSTNEYPPAEPEALPPPPPQVLPPEPSKADQLLALLREIIETILLTLVIFFLIRFTVENYRIDGRSMNPDFQDGQYLLVNKLTYKIGSPQRNDVIVFHYPLNETQNYIKRVIGLPGDKVEIRQGRILINDRPITQPYPHNPAEYSWGPAIVDPDKYFVLGDNRPESSDSHAWGYVPARDIVGKAWISYWPPDEWGIVPDYPATVAASPPAGQ